MIEKINIALLSGVCLMNAVCGSEDQHGLPGGWNYQNVVMGVVVTPENEPPMPEVLSMVQDIRRGVVPQKVIELFQGLTKIDIDLQRDHVAMNQANWELSNELPDRIHSDKQVRDLNICLRALATPMNPEATYIPLAQEFFGPMNRGILVTDFYRMICRAYNILFTSDMPVSAHIRTPADWTTVQLLGFFFTNAIGRLGFLIDAGELKDPELTAHIAIGLSGASSISIIGLEKLSQAHQELVLKKLAEVRPKNTQVILKPSNMDEFERSVTSLINSAGGDARAAGKVDVSLVVEFSKESIHGTLQIQRLLRFLTLHPDVVVPGAWDLMLKLRGFENIAFGHLTPILKAFVQSPLGAHLSLPNLPAEHVTTKYVMTKLREEFLTEKSKVRLLDFEGSKLSAEGWEQLALLVESRKPFYKLRLTGMQIPTSIAPRLGALRVEGLNMKGCGVPADVLQNMVAGWLDGAVTLKGVDLCGNEVNQTIANMFFAAGFEGYMQDRKRPFGYLFAKP